jgi:hypothetical protein
MPQCRIRLFHQERSRDPWELPHTIAGQASFARLYPSQSGQCGTALSARAKQGPQRYDRHREMNPATIFRTEVLASLTLNGPADRGRGRLLVLCADDALRSKFAARLGWSGMALAIDDPPWRRSCRS